MYKQTPPPPVKKKTPNSINMHKRKTNKLLKHFKISTDYHIHVPFYEIIEKYKRFLCILTLCP